MRKPLLIGICTVFVLAIAPSVQIAQASTIGGGVLADVIDCETGDSVPKTPDNLGAYVVIPGGTYEAYLTNIETVLTGTTTVYIKGKYTDGSSWIITLTGQTITEAHTITTDCFTIPSTAGCTIVVAYDTPGRLASDPNPPPQPGHMKTYYSWPGEPVSCVAGIPEFPFGSAVVISLALIGALAIRRYRRV